MTDFEKFYGDHWDCVFKYLMKLTRNASLSEELAQETFFRAYVNYSKLRKEEKATAWLCQIAKNTYFAWYNEQKKHGCLGELADNAQSVQLEQAFLQKESAEKALACLHKLPEPYREIFMRKVFADMSLKDISKSFGKSESWARVTYYRAKQKLIEKMR